MGGETMSERMWRNILSNSSFQGQSFDQQKHRLTAQGAAPLAQKNHIALTGLNV